ncbi:MAG: DUF6544 family protein [Kineosporiaceae bacterium]
MRTVLRWALVLITALHGLIHLLGAAKGLGWAQVPVLKEPIGVAAGLGWFLAAALMLLTAVLVALRADRWWWAAAAPAVLVSQVVIVSSWNDAKAGTLANLLLAAAAGYGFASHGRPSLRARFHREAAAALDGLTQASNGSGVLVTDADLENLPSCVAGYLRRAGVVGHPRVSSFRATIHGRIRSDPAHAWMPFTGEQVNTYGSAPTRQFFIDASRSGLPVDVLHVYSHGHASMQVRLCSLAPLVDAHGPDLDRAETVTVFNDLCVLAPAALIDPAVTWRACDEHRARAVFTLAGNAVTADLVFNDDHELVDFLSDDRSMTSTDGKAFVPQRWSTPLDRYQDFDARHVAVDGQAHWHTPVPDGEFSYLDFHVDQIDYNVAPLRTTAASPQSSSAV